MRLTLHSFVSDVPPEKVCRPGVDYQVFEAEVGPEEAAAFFDKLKLPRDSFYLETPECLLNFWKDRGAIWVEVTSWELWAASEVSREEAEAVIRALHRGEAFGHFIPTAEREWDAYSLPGDAQPASGDTA